MKSFAQLFAGRNDAFGIWTPSGNIRSDGKVDGEGRTYPNRRFPDRVLTERDWANHLDGKAMLGIVPINLDNKCGWFAIDIDDYHLDHESLVRKVEDLELPLIVCRSKSGGAHLYAFCTDVFQARFARQLGIKWAKLLKYEKAEIFPKQDEALSTGNWINLPYFGGDSSNRYAYGLQGERLTLNEFIQFANAKACTPDEFEELLGGQKKLSEDDILNDSPPCIITMMNDGVSHGGRNNAAFHIAIWLRKIDDYLEKGNWRDKLYEYNERFFQPPLSNKELLRIIRNSVGKDYNLYCKQHPMCDICNRDVCIQKRFGIRDNVRYQDLEIFGATKIDSDPPIWILDIEGTQVKFTTDELITPRLFKRTVLEKMNRVIHAKKQIDHDSIIQPIIQYSLVVEPAFDMTVEGKVDSVFKEWTTNVINRAKNMKDVHKGLPFYDKEENIIYFRGPDFIRQYRMKYKDQVSDRHIWAGLRENGFSKKQVRFKRNPEWIWYFEFGELDPWFDMEMDEEF